jgi:DUF971 family protein
MVQAPTNIRALREPPALEVTWPDGRVEEIRYRRLREECPCAQCVDELTGVRVLDVAMIPDDIRPAGVSFVGNYALKITWSDGHDTGLYSWELLRRLGGADGT